MQVRSVLTGELPLPVDVFLHGARPRVRECLAAVELEATGMEVERDEVEPALGVSSGSSKVDLHASHRVDNSREALEVDLEVVLDRDVEVRREGVDHLLRSRVKC